MATCFKSVSWGLPPNPYCHSETAPIRLVVVPVEPLWGELGSSAVTLREGVRVILHDFDDIFPVLLVEMIMEPVKSPRGPRADREGTGSLCCAFWEAGVIYLG